MTLTVYSALDFNHFSSFEVISLNDAGLTDEVSKIVLRIAKIPTPPVGWSVNTDLAVLGIDSLKFLELVVAIEQKYEVSFPDEFLSFELLGSVRRVVSSLETLRIKR